MYNSRKSSAINSFHRRSNYKSFHNSGADQFENRVNVLEELVYQVHKDVFFKRVKKNQQIKDLVINFEESLKKIIQKDRKVQHAQSLPSDELMASPSKKFAVKLEQKLTP